VDFGALTARCRDRLAELDLPRPFDVKVLCERVGRRRDRSIVLLGMTLPADAPRGLWISTERKDYIVYERATSPLHQDHIILHELAHLLCDHTGALEFGEEHAHRLFPTLDPELVARVLGRTAYTSEEEQEAEILASMMLREAERHRRPPRETDPAAADNLRRLESGL
jgi:IrrE N-terminal-like domain